MAKQKRAENAELTALWTFLLPIGCNPHKR